MATAQRPLTTPGRIDVICQSGKRAASNGAKFKLTTTLQNIYFNF